MIYRNRHLPHFLRRHGTDVSQVGPLNAALDDARSHLIGASIVDTLLPSIHPWVKLLISQCETLPMK